MNDMISSLITYLILSFCVVYITQEKGRDKWKALAIVLGITAIDVIGALLAMWIKENVRVPTVSLICLSLIVYSVSFKLLGK